MAKYTTVRKTAIRLNLSERRIQALCHDGRIEGALMLGGVWMIPDDAQKPAYFRESDAHVGMAGQLSVFDFMTGETMLDLGGACDFLGISTATGNNWLKAHRLVPSAYSEGKPIFTLDSLRILLSQISLEDGNTLKSRRNKSQITGIASYGDYLSDTDSCQDASELIREMVSLAKNEPDIEPLIPLILAEYAIQFLIATGRIDGRNDHGHISRPTICAYFKDELDLGIYEPLIEAFFTSNPILHGQAPAILEDMMTFHLPFVPGQDVLGLLYISLKSLKDRKATGTYYTPNRLVAELLDQYLSLKPETPQAILDPCCGTGNFLLALLQAGFTPDMLYAQDNDELSIAIARINLILNSEPAYLDVIQKQLTCQDTLLTPSMKETYDLVIGNPPWGCRFERDTAEMLKKRYTTSGTTIESFRLFAEYALDHLKENGVLAYVLPESFLFVDAHDCIRKKLVKEANLKSVRFEPKGFQHVACPAILLVARKEKADFSPITIYTEDKTFTIENDRHLDTEPLWNLQADDYEYRLLESIDHLSGAMTLSGSADFALGIVTGNNAAYLIPREEYLEHPDRYPQAEPVLTGREIMRFGHAEAANYIIFDPSAFQQTAKETYYRAPEKLLYRFISNGKGIFCYDDRKTLTLNSANIVIPQIPMFSDLYLLGILNSSLAGYYFEHRFHSVKMLRSHIESLPIPRLDGNQQQNVIDITRQMMVCNTDDAENLYRALNAEVYRLYHLTSAEIALIEASFDYAKESQLVMH